MANLKDRFKTFIQKTFFKEEYEERIKSEKLKAKIAADKRATDRLSRKINRKVRKLLDSDGMNLNFDKFYSNLEKTEQSKKGVKSERFKQNQNKPLDVEKVKKQNEEQQKEQEKQQQVLRPKISQ